MGHPLDRLPAEALQILRAFRTDGEAGPARAVTFGTLRERLVCERDGWYQRFRRGLTPLLLSGLIEEIDKPRKGPALRYALTPDGRRALSEAFPREGKRRKAASAAPAR